MPVFSSQSWSGLWGLKTLRFDLERVPRNLISWQSLSLELRRWPSLVSAAGAPRAAADLQLCAWEEKNRGLCYSRLVDHVSYFSAASVMSHPENYCSETGKCKRDHCSDTETEGLKSSVCLKQAVRRNTRRRCCGSACRAQADVHHATPGW